MYYIELPRGRQKTQKCLLIISIILTIVLFIMTITPIFLILFNRRVIVVPFGKNAIVVNGVDSQVMGPGFHTIDADLFLDYEIISNSPNVSSEEAKINFEEDDYHAERSVIVEAETTWKYKDIKKSKYNNSGSFGEMVRYQNQDFTKQIKSFICSFDKEEGPITEDSAIDKDALANHLKDNFDDDNSIDVYEVKITKIKQLNERNFDYDASSCWHTS